MEFDSMDVAGHRVCVIKPKQLCPDRKSLTPGILGGMMWVTLVMGGSLLTRLGPVSQWVVLGILTGFCALLLLIAVVWLPNRTRKPVAPPAGVPEVAVQVTCTTLSDSPGSEGWAWFESGQLHFASKDFSFDLGRGDVLASRIGLTGITVTCVSLPGYGSPKVTLSASKLDRAKIVGWLRVLGESEPPSLLPPMLPREILAPDYSKWTAMKQGVLVGALWFSPLMLVMAVCVSLSAPRVNAAALALMAGVGLVLGLVFGSAMGAWVGWTIWHAHLGSTRGIEDRIRKAEAKMKRAEGH